MLMVCDLEQLSKIQSCIIGLDIELGNIILSFIVILKCHVHNQYLKESFSIVILAAQYYCKFCDYHCS